MKTKLINQNNFNSRLVVLYIVLLTGALLIPNTVFSQWQELPISIAANSQFNSMITTDDSGGE